MNRFRHAFWVDSGQVLRVALVSLVVVLGVAETARCQDPGRTDGFGASHVTVSGTVTDTSRRGVPDARVYLVMQNRTGAGRSLATRTDDAGVWSFKLEQVPDSDSLVVLAFKSGHSLGISKKDFMTYLGSEGQPKLGETIDLSVQLGPTSPRVLRVVDDRGDPVSAARLEIVGMGKANGAGYFYWINPLLPDWSWETDAHGRVTIDNLPADHTASLTIGTSRHGTQRVGLNIEPAEAGTAAETVVQLLPVCRVEVALVGPESSQLSGREITVEGGRPRAADSEASEPSGLIRPWGGQARVRSDASGKAIAVVPAGTLSVSVSRSAVDRLFAEQPLRAESEPGQTVILEVRFQPGTRLTGRVQTPEGEPVAGVVMYLSGSEVASRDDGTIEAWVPTDQPLYGQIGRVPDGFAHPFENQLRIPAPSADETAAAKSEREIPAVILRRAVPISGRVVDEAGQPVPGARVLAYWVQQHESAGYYTLKSDSAVSDRLGHFRLSHVFPDVDVIVTAQTPDKSVMESTPFHSAEPREVPLTVSSDGMVSIVGTVRSSDDQGIPNVAVKVVRAMLGPNDHNYGSRRIELSGRQEFPGATDGSFVLPGKLPRFSKYSVTISAPGYMAVETPFLAPPSSGPALDLGITRLTRARVATGIVRDSGGAPVAGAEVWSWAAPTDGGRSYQGKSKSRTDSNGRFKLDKLHPLSPLLFASKEEYRLTGCALPSDSAEFAVTLFRTDETIPEAHTVQPAQLDNTLRHAAATRMLESVIGVQRNSNYFHGEILSILVKSDADVARQELGRTTSPAARAETLARLGEIQDAVAEVEGVSDPYSRAHCRLEMADSLDDADEIRQLLAAALLDAQAIAQPDHRVVIVANIVERYGQLGDQDQVATILREERPRAEALSTAEWPGYARGLFAAQLARTDPQTALRIASEAAADDQARHYQNIAHVVAASNPAAAEEALGRIGKHLYVDDPAVRVAYRMAPVDLPRSIRLVEQIDTSQFRHTEKTRGLGVIAWAIRTADRQKARELLRRAFDLVPEQHGGSGSRSDDVFGTALTLLQFAEEVDPEHLTDYFWLTASLHAGPTGAGWTPDDALREDAERQSHLVLLFARYDAVPELPRRIMTPVFNYWEGQIGTKSHHFTDHEGTFMAMALTDPQRAGDWAVRFHEKLEAEDRRYIPQPWEIIGRALTDDRESIGKSITRKVFHRWVIDQFDP